MHGATTARPRPSIDATLQSGVVASEPSADGAVVHPQAPASRLVLAPGTARPSPHLSAYVGSQRARLRGAMQMRAVAPRRSPSSASFCVRFRVCRRKVESLGNLKLAAHGHAPDVFGVLPDAGTLRILPLADPNADREPAILLLVRLCRCRSFTLAVPHLSRWKSSRLDPAAHCVIGCHLSMLLVAP